MYSSLLSNTDQIRKADQIMIQDFQYPGLLLMESAGRQCAEWVIKNYGSRRLFVILVGPGNNGGDGLVIARYLQNARKNVKIILSHEPDRFVGDAKINWDALKGANLDFEVYPTAIPELLLQNPKECLIVDALLGTGIQEELRGSVAEIVAKYSEINAEVIAIDLPSGLDADTGKAINSPLQAIATLTFQIEKRCHRIHPAASYCGEIVCFDIGIWPEVVQGLNIKTQILEKGYCQSVLRSRPIAGHKGTFGHALIVGGSTAFPGATALSGIAALKSGSGLATIFTTSSARCAALERYPELMVKAWGTDSNEWLNKEALPILFESIHGKSALALGPGLGNEAETTDFLKGVLQMWPRPLVIDADGLNQIASEPELWRYVPQGSILTPHPGEMQRLLPGFDVLNQRLEAAEKLSQQKQVIVVLKGAGTIVAFPDGHSFVNSSGNEGMATAGAGDVLTGMLVGLLAQGYRPEQATLLAVYLHGLAGDICRANVGASEAVTASGILETIGKALASLQ